MTALLHAVPFGEAHTFTTYTFTDEADIPVSTKQALLRDWRRFISGGFNRVLFGRELYRFLIYRCAFVAHSRLDHFWVYYFNSEAAHLRDFLAQFGGNQISVEHGDRTWLADPASDLKAAMCEEAGRLYEPLSQVLQDLEVKHEELIAAWHEFAVTSGIQEASLPPSYLVSENTRHLLAYAAHIALRQRRPLAGLQQMFPFPPELFQPSLAEGGQLQGALE